MKIQTGTFSLTLLLLLGLFAASGCVNLDPRTDPTRFYLVEVPPGADVEAGLKVPPVAIRSLRLADYLDRPEIMVRRQGNQVVRLSEDRWAGQPSMMLEREVVRWFQGRSGGASQVIGSPWDSALPEGTWQLSWQVLRMEGIQPDKEESKGEALLGMSWVWQTPDGTRVEGKGQWTAPWTTGQPVDLVRILGELLATGFAEMEQTGYGRKN